MSQEFQAIYEHGVLRPLTPLDLPESAKVVVTLREASAATRQTTDPLIGLMSDDPELVDQVVESVMTARESHPLRADG
jgi:predicted DNA-binding antitoxin AbrB/MazE fold protein